jgi:hypothetical protein
MQLTQTSVLARISSICTDAGFISAGARKLGVHPMTLHRILLQKSELRNRKVLHALKLRRVVIFEKVKE